MWGSEVGCVCVMSIWLGTRAVKQQDQASIRTQEAVAGLEARLATLMLTQHDQPPPPSTDTTQLHKVRQGPPLEETAATLAQC